MVVPLVAADVYAPMSPGVSVWQGSAHEYELTWASSPQLHPAHDVMSASAVRLPRPRAAVFTALLARSRRPALTGSRSLVTLLSAASVAFGAFAWRPRPRL